MNQLYRGAFSVKCALKNHVLEGNRMLLQKNIVGKRFKIAFITDWHLGNAASSDECIGKMVELIGQNNWYWWHLGDAFEATDLNNSYFEPLVHKARTSEIKYQAEDFVSRVKPIKKRCLALHKGNHDQRRSICNVFDPMPYAREQLGIKVPVADQIKIRVAEHCTILGKHSRIYVSSRAKGSQQQRYTNECESIKNKLIRTSGIADCHAVVCGHGHKIRIAPPVENTDLYGIDKLHHITNDRYVGGDGTCLHNDSRYYAMCGGALRTTIAQVYDPEADPIKSSTGEVLSKGTVDISTYSERKGYGYTDLGFVLATVDGGRLVNMEGIKL
ncbi:MAG: hypothetical protein GF334_05070 [Candidatus Altiarchaeales archaeon]|nr:hypothetical protein [Candidatus Altiarchaeales archaeon]